MAELTHFDSDGNARMVDVGAKSVTARTAVATCRVTLRPETLQRIQTGQIAKGDVLAVARLAGIMGAKRTSELIPLCHPLRLDGVEIEFAFAGETAVLITGTVRATDRTGVEMEALTAVSIAALTIYDMCKSVDREMNFGPVELLRKTGGKSGDWHRPRSSGS